MTRSVSEITTSLEDLANSSFDNEAERVQVEQALRSALRRVQRPFDTVLDHVWTEPVTTAFIKHLIDTDLFTKWAKQGSGPLSVAELSSLSGVEESLLSM